MSVTRHWWFVGGDIGDFTVRSVRAICGPGLPDSNRMLVTNVPPGDAPAAYCLRGVTSNERYTTRAEKAALVAEQVALGGPESRYGALIPIKKSDAWWALSQDERRVILEERSRHIAMGMRVLPAISRRLHHCRDLGTDEPFDFLTWFDFRPGDEPAFDDLLGMLRSTEEWNYVVREVDVRVAR